MPHEYAVRAAPRSCGRCTPPLRESHPPPTMGQVALDWDDFRFVLALRRAGSLGGAARLLKCEQSTAGRRLGALEAELGLQLVTRTPEGVT